MIFLPTTKKEVEFRGWEELDVILFTGDAYVDHPSFGCAVIGRVLEAEGLKVAIVPQPNWQDDGRDFYKLGRPRLFFGVTSGNMDSMVNHYTANIRLRSDDAYTSGGKAGFRPDYATYQYVDKLKHFFPDVPVIIGGIEASLRRLTHYDYWNNQLKPSILAECKADLLVYGIGEKPIREIVRQLKGGASFEQVKSTPQCVYMANSVPKDGIKLHSFENCVKDKKMFGENFVKIETESNRYQAETISEKVGSRFVVVNAPYPPMTTDETDATYDLPYTYLPHPKYQKRGAIPAYEMIKFSVNVHRGCFGGCSFCTISAHQGKFISSRSEESILNEVDQISQLPDFKGNLSDVGGPSANMYKMQGKNLDICRQCKKPSCIHPSVCKNLNADHQPLLNIYRKVSDHKAVKKLFIGSGIRYDLAFADKSPYLEEVIEHHISGRFKVAPEHTSEKILRLIRKPPFELFKRFKKLFDEVNQKNGKRQQLIPYFISSLPGCRTEDMALLAIELKNLKYQPEQVQDLTPTPMTLSSVMFYTGGDPYTGEKLYIAKNQNQKRRQRDFFFYYTKEGWASIKHQLLSIGKKGFVTKVKDVLEWTVFLKEEGK